VTRKLLPLLLVCFLFITTAWAEISPYDFTVSSLLISKDPSHFYGYRIAAGYRPNALTWDKAFVYFDLSYGHWWILQSSPHRSINIYSLAPILRAYIGKFPKVSPFIEASIGISYLSRTRIDSRNLGMHFSFQDQIGFGLAFGPEQRLGVSLSILHYSNGSLSSHNAGITVPLLLNANYRF
jgi:hypothetical protein